MRIFVGGGGIAILVVVAIHGDKVECITLFFIAFASNGHTPEKRKNYLSKSLIFCLS